MLRDEAKRERNQARDLAGSVNRYQEPRGSVGVNMPAYTTANGQTYPSTAGVYYWLQPQVQTGLERVGVAPTFTPVGVPILAKHNGTTAPPVNSLVLMIPVLRRNTFDW